MVDGESEKSSRRKWFRKTNSKEINDDALKVANAAQGESEKLLKKARESLKGIDLSSGLQTTHSGLLNQLRQYADPKSVENVAAGTLEDALKARSEWEERRARGHGKVGSAIQRFATNLAYFFGAYSDIINAVKKVGGPYGEAGYQAISILLFVAANKSLNDEFITDELENLVDCFPRIDLLAQLYPDDRIERHVLEVYSGVIFFARDATAYFLHSSKRFIKSVQPQRLAVERQIDDIKRSLAELNSWSTVFMHQKTQDLVDGKNRLLEDNRKLLGEVAELRRKLNDMETRDLQKQQQDQLDALESVRASLDRPDEKLNSNLEECLRNQENAFPNSNHHSKSSAKYLQMSLTLLEMQDSYRAWIRSSDGCLLALGGRTKPEGQLHKSGYSWLSPAAIDVALSLQKKGEAVGFFSCHPKSWLSDEEMPMIQDLVAGLLFQILRSETSILTDDFQRQRADLDIGTWVKRRDKETLDAIRRSVVGLFRKASKNRWVYLVIDRAERCKVGLKLLLEWLRELVTDSECKIKVLAVHDAVKSDMSEQDWEHFSEDSKGYFYSKIGWNQEKMTIERFPLREPPVISFGT